MNGKKKRKLSWGLDNTVQKLLVAGKEIIRRQEHREGGKSLVPQVFCFKRWKSIF